MYKSQTEGTDDRRVGRQKTVDETGEGEGGQSCNVVTPHGTKLALKTC